MDLELPIGILNPGIFSLDNQRVILFGGVKTNRKLLSKVFLINLRQKLII